MSHRNDKRYIPDDRMNRAIHKRLKHEDYPAPPPVKETSYRKEHMLRTIHRLLLRNVSTEAIASAVGVEPNYVTELIRELRERLRLEATQFDMAGHVGSSLAFFQEVRASALRIASDGSFGGGARVTALNVALEAQKDTIRFLQAIGAYENNPMVWGAKGDENVSKGNMLQQMAEAFLSDTPMLLDEEGNEIEQPTDDIKFLEGI